LVFCVDRSAAAASYIIFIHIQPQLFLCGELFAAMFKSASIFREKFTEDYSHALYFFLPMLTCDRDYREHIFTVCEACGFLIYGSESILRSR